ncbi:MAG: ComEC/Rec2 family competence protein [Propionibacteriaceae bacterium]|nr:ComEC/Rec2 family competence protein [Propionibacteriaceae bacterium]
MARDELAEADGLAPWRVLVLGASAWAATALATSGERVGPAVVMLVAGAVALAGWHRSSWFLAAVAVVAGVCGVAGGAHAVARASDPLTAVAQERAIATVELRVAGGGRLWAATGHRPALWRGSAEVVVLEARGQRWVSGAPVEVAASGELAAAWAAVPMGSVVRAGVRLGEPEPGSGVHAEVRAREPPVVVAEPDPVARVVGDLRRGLVEACAPLWPDARGLVPALVVGDTSGLSEDLQDRFKVTGLTHLTAVSGSNLVLLLGFLRAAAVGCGIRGRWLMGTQVFGVGGFVALCLGEPSVLRAAAMGLVGLAALGRAGRGRQGLRFLGVAILIVVLAEPAMARSWGFALSVLATFGLLCWGTGWADLLAQWMPRWCAEALAVPLAAQVATEPVVVMLSGQVSVVAVVANLVAGPMVGPATVLGLVATLVAAPLPVAAVVPAWGAGWFAQGIAWTARLGDALPGAAVPWPADGASVTVVVLGCVVLVLLAPTVLPRRWLCLVLAAGVVVSLVRVPTTPGWPPRAWAVLSCDVGQGDATLLAAAPGVAVLVDTGPDPAALSRCLAQAGVRQVPLVVLTHLHHDHAGAIEAVAGLGVERVVTSGVRTPAAADARVDAVLPDAERTVAVAGERWQVGEVEIWIGAVPDLGRELVPSDGESSAENDASLLLRAEVGGLSVLLAGDAEERGQASHLALGDALDSDVLVVPHHGSGRHDPRFIAAGSPAVAIVSVGADNDYGHPSASTLRSVDASGAALFRTDERGAIAVVRRSDGVLEVTTQR